jgi:predicted MFS family arabinose efflux permease
MQHLDSKKSLIAAIIFSVMAVFAMMTGPIYIGALVDHLGFDFGQASLIVSLEYLGIALASLCAAFWMQQVSWKTAGLFAAAVIIAGNILSVSANSFEALRIIRFLVGFFGEGTAFVVAIAVISSTSDQQRNFGFSIAAQVTFGVIAMVVFPRVISGYGFSGLMFPLALLALLFSLAAIWIPSGASIDDGAGDDLAETTTASALPSLIVLLAMFIWCTGLGAIWNFVERIAIDQGGLTTAGAGDAIAVSTACAIAGGLIASALGSRFGSFLPVTVAITVQIIMIWFLQGEMSWIQFAMTAAFFQIFWNITGPFLMGAVAMTDPTGKVSLAIPAAQIGGLFLGLAFAGQMVNTSGLVLANYIAIGCCILALLVFAPIGLRLNQKSS